MTEELRQKANEYHKQIEDTQNRLNIILDMCDSGNSLTLHDTKIGSVGIQPNGALKYDILDIVVHALTRELNDLQEEYKKL